MRNIHESNPNWFEKEEAASELGEDGLCPVCGCCSLVEAEMAPGSIFVQAEQIQSGKPAERRLVCAGGCERDQRHP